MLPSTLFIDADFYWNIKTVMKNPDRNEILFLIEYT